MGSISSWREAVDGLIADLRAVLDTRLRSLVVYEAHGTLGDTSAADRRLFARRPADVLQARQVLRNESRHFLERAPFEDHQQIASRVILSISPIVLVVVKFSRAASSLTRGSVLKLR